MFRKVRFSTRAHLFALGLAIVMPLLTFGALILLQYASYERGRSEDTAEQLAGNITRIVDSELEQSLALLRGLAGSEALVTRNYAQFYEEARRALGAEKSVIILRDAEGQQFVNTAVPPGAPPRRGVPLSAEEQRAFHEGKPFVSNVYRAPGDGEPRYAVGVTVMRDGKPDLLLGLTSPTARIHESLKEATPAGWISTIGDRAFNFVARSERHDEVTGKPAQRAYYDKAVGRSGHFQLTSLFGVELVAGYYTSELSGWLTGANIPVAVVSAPYRRSLTLTAITAAFALALSMMFAYLVSRSFAAATHGLAQQAIALGEGRKVEPFETHLADLNVVSDALVSASQAIKRREQERELLTNELNHRVKNTLASIQAIAHNTLRGSTPPEVRQALTDRLIALSKAHDVLTAQNWRGAELHELMEGVRKGFASADRLIVTGPRIWLQPNAALAMSLTMTELATNAAKYGALSSGDGRVDVRWDVVPDTSALRVEWIESGGPTVQLPERKGFGWRLINSAFAETNGTARLTFEPGGVRCLIEVPPTQFSKPA